MRNDFQNLQTKRDGKFIHRDIDRVATAARFLLGVSNGFVHELGVFRHRRGFEQQTGIRCGVARLVFADAREVAGVRDDFRDLLELIELGERCACGLRSFESCCRCHKNLCSCEARPGAIFTQSFNRTESRQMHLS